jgi:nucleotide-binding universal stress UspA family protein
LTGVNQLGRRRTMMTTNSAPPKTPTPERQVTIVVGVDGSPGSLRAVEWAATEAERRGGVLEIHTAYSPGYVFVTADDIRQAMQRIIEEATSAAAETAPDIPVRGVAHEATPARSLIAASRDADLLVVGSRGRGGFAGLLLGSVSQQCSLHAHCTTVIVRTPDAHEGAAQ